ATPAPGTRPRRRSIGTLDTVTGGFLDRGPRCLRLVPAVDLVRIKLSLRSEAKPIHFRRLGLSPTSVQDFAAEGLRACARRRLASSLRRASAGPSRLRGRLNDEPRRAARLLRDEGTRAASPRRASTPPFC